CNSKGTHKSSEAPSPVTDIIFVDKRHVRKIFCSVDLVFYLILSHLQVCFLFKFFSPITGPGVVDAYNNISLLCKQLMPETNCPKTIGNLLRAGTAVVTKEQRILLIRIK